MCLVQGMNFMINFSFFSNNGRQSFNYEFETMDALMLFYAYRNHEVWEFNFIDLTWQRKHTSNKRPNPRYGQTQVRSWYTDNDLISL